MSNATERRAGLAALHADIVDCSRCRRLVAHCQKIAREKRRAYQDCEYWGRPVPGFGDPNAQLLLVGLAPGAHGANRTGRVFTGDRSGEWLYRALHRAAFASQAQSLGVDDGMRLQGAFITCAARCAPPGNRPTPKEVLACRPFLVRELELLTRLKVIIGLGQIGFDAVLRTFAARGVETPKPRPRFGHGAEVALGERQPILLGSYHPSQQNTQTGRLTQPMLDRIFRRARALLKS